MVVILLSIWIVEYGNPKLLVLLSLKVNNKIVTIFPSCSTHLSLLYSGRVGSSRSSYRVTKRSTLLWKGINAVS